MAFEREMKEVMLISNVEHHYLQIEVKAFLGDDKTLWNWEIKIAIDRESEQDRYFGMALDRKYNVFIPWRELKEYDYMQEIKNLCMSNSKYQTPQNV
ncbi:hypothetical protein BHU24_22385 [Bacillus pseudomycoides]|uniref:hypothetical protein n=1 Tax=Bacillus pseudomycoides TaxID=64104 RepID=UPI0017801FF4|nr:hypothetical protein [Bacillus pseudomycoides]MBD5799396.1 hypothetical protein [Bacillus pseudomycoides]